MNNKFAEEIFGSFDERRAKRKTLTQSFIGALVEEDVDALQEVTYQILDNETKLIYSAIMPMNGLTAFITLTALREVVKAIESRNPEAAKEATVLQGCTSTTVVEIDADTIKRAKDGEENENS